MPRPRQPSTSGAGRRASARVHGIVAREARTAILFRRGPAKQVRLLVWDLATDHVEGGQWLAGRVYEERCDVSPDGKLLVYFAGKYTSKVATFTAICRPPYFTALAFWPDDSTWGGGGIFETNRRVALQYGRVDFELSGGSTIPEDFEVVSITDARKRLGDAATDLARHGFTVVQRGIEAPGTGAMRYVFEPPWIEQKPAPGRSGMTLRRLCHGIFETNGLRSVHSYELAVTTGKAQRATTIVDLGRHDWADWDHDGSLLSSSQGRLYRHDVTQAHARPSEPLPTKLVADLADMTFAARPPPPSAREWPASNVRGR